MGSLNTDPDSQSGSGSKREKMTHKIRRKSIRFIFWSDGCSFLRNEGFCCSLDILYEILGISKLQFFTKRIHVSPVFFSSIFGHQNLGSGSGSGFTYNAGSGCVSGFGLNENGSSSLLYPFLIIQVWHQYRHVHARVRENNLLWLFNFWCRRCSTHRHVEASF